MEAPPNEVAADETAHPQPTPRPVLEVDGLEQRLVDRERGSTFVVTVGRRLTINDGDFVALLGPSGCGKTTLLSVLGLLRRPTDPAKVGRFSLWVTESGKPTEIDLRECWQDRSENRIESLRRKHVGFALQSGELLPSLTVRENIAVPLRINRVGAAEASRRVEELLDAFKLRRVKGGDRPSRDSLADSRVNKLSGGEYQRVSLARAIAHRPRLTFVDEPTAALNREMARDALIQFRELQRQRTDPGATIMITHDETLADEFANLIIRMAPVRGRAAGEVVEATRRDAPAISTAIAPTLPVAAAASMERRYTSEEASL